MRKNKHGRKLSILLLVLLLGLSSTPSNVLPTHSGNSINPGTNDADYNPYNEKIESSKSVEGVINPLEIETRGYKSSGVIEARTDTSVGTSYDLPLDITHGWLGSTAEIDIWNLERIYVINGTFNEGIPGSNENPNGTVTYRPYGWNATSAVLTTEEQTPIASYSDDSPNYVSAENIGTFNSHPNNPSYSHYQGTQVFWNQTFTNIPSTSNFLLSFSYLYLRGPLIKPGGDPLTGNCSISVYLDNTEIWSKSLLTLESQDTWFDVNDFNVNISVGLTASFAIGLKITQDMELFPEDDYNGDGIQDGAFNTQFISINLDNVELVSLIPPSPSEVNLQFTADQTTTSIIGTVGVGSAYIANSSYWDISPVSVSVSANISVAFLYETRLLSHRFRNSTWTTDITKEGVIYSVSTGTSPDLSTYTYIGSIEGYNNLTILIPHPIDWENLTILDPFLDDVTNECIISPGNVEISTDLLNRLGWWVINAQSPNFAYSLNSQILNTFSWKNSSIFRSTNISRAQVEIRTQSQIPEPGFPVKISFIMPNGTVWFSENVTDMVLGITNSSSVTYGSLNTTAGMWKLEAFWTNGTEIAFSSTTFEIHHQSILIEVNSYIETEAGETITNFVRFIDAENGEYIMTSALIVANWSNTEIIFSPNDVRNSWEADFDTSLISPGNNTVIVNASVDYFDNATCSFIIRAVYANNQLQLDSDTAQIGLFSNHTAVLHFEDSFGNDIDGATIDISYTGDSGGLELSPITHLGNGNYSVNITGQLSGSYSISFKATKSYYEFAEDTLFLFVNTIETDMTILNGSAAAISYGQTYEVFVEYVNFTGHGLDDATVQIITVTPSTGLVYGSSIPHGDGVYSFSLSATSSATYSIVIQANKTNHNTQIVSFTLSFTNESAILSVDISTSIQVINQEMEVSFTLVNSTGGSIEGATISCINLPDNVPIYEFSESGDGNYSIIMAINTTGSYQLVFVSTVPNHLDASTSLTITIVDVPTKIVNPLGVSTISTVYGEEYNLSLYYERTDLSENITSGTITISGLDLEGLSWNIIKNGEGYIISFDSDEPGIWSVIITASKDNYQSANIDIIIEIRPIASELQIFSPNTPLTVTRNHTFQFSFLEESSLDGIENADISASGTGFEWVDWISIGNGVYNITVSPLEIGTYRVQFVFSRIGFESQQGTFNYQVEEIPLGISIEPIVWQQGRPLNIQIELIESDTGAPATGAYVEYRLSAEGISPVTGILDESESGVYSTTITPPWPGESGYVLSITVDKELSQLSSAFSTTITTVPDVAAEIMRTITLYGSAAIGIVAAVVLSVVGYRYKKQKEHEKFVRAMNIKNRFDDANNLIGLVVLHKVSGLPIYSRAIKGGFEEGMIGAFITAITHFQSEFEENERDTLFQVIPISDILRIVPTQELMCAFITINPASKEQEKKMIEYARRVGDLLDDSVSVETSQVHDDETIDTLDQIFDNVMDGFLLADYRFRSEIEYSEKFNCILEGVNKLDSESFKLVELARSMASCGIRVADTYLLIMEAYELGLLQQVGQSELNSLDLTSDMEIE
ncbi:MAG: exported protein of unknown function [Candidatus Thorarchaeota archaeon]|nr:MAG: exported protein of unknown function [Candidatus Thorarchaeota archaeon]